MEPNNQLSLIIKNLIQILNYYFIDSIPTEALAVRSMATSSTDGQYWNNGDFVYEDNPILQPVAGDRVDVYWPFDDQFYSVTIVSISYQGKQAINYDDSYKKTHRLADKVWAAIPKNNWLQFLTTFPFIKSAILTGI